MSIQAAQRMGLRCLSIDPSLQSPSSRIAESLQAQLDDPEALVEVLSRCHRVTLENEFVPATSIQRALDASGADPGILTPPLDSLATVQDKLLQRQALARAGVPSPRALALEGDGSQAVRQLGFPMVLKARFGGYDGKGTRFVRDLEQLESLRAEWGNGGWLAEQFVEFRRELAAMVFIGGQSRGTFPTMETIQVNHVCDLVFPCDADGSEIALAAVEAVGGMGLFGVELFELEDGSILVNELAPRPHNTGHYTLDWGGVSQFEQHVRLVMGWPAVEPLGWATCMANLLGIQPSGDYRKGIEAALQEPEVRVHWYEKEPARHGRKMGHLNVPGRSWGYSPQETPSLVRRAREARDRFYEAWAEHAGQQVE